MPDSSMIKISLEVANTAASVPPYNENVLNPMLFVQFLQFQDSQDRSMKIAYYLSPEDPATVPNVAIFTGGISQVMHSKSLEFVQGITRRWNRGLHTRILMWDFPTYGASDVGIMSRENLVLALEKLTDHVIRSEATRQTIRYYSYCIGIGPSFEVGTMEKYKGKKGLFIHFFVIVASCQR